MAQENKKILAAPAGSSRKMRRVGRGQGSGWGCTAGRGNKGAQSRSGYSRRVGFEGGQMPLVRRIPKFGFTNAPFKKDVTAINISQLVALFGETAEITKEMFEQTVLKKSVDGYVKLLSGGEVKSAITVTVDMASKEAIKKIEAAGGKVILTERKKWTREKKS